MTIESSTWVVTGTDICTVALPIVGDSPLVPSVERGTYLFYPTGHSHFSGRLAFPARVFKAACVQAARGIAKVSMTKMRGMFYAMGLEDNYLVPIFSDMAVFRELKARRGEESLVHVFYRLECANWRTVVMVRFDRSQVTLKGLTDIFNIMGSQGGMCCLQYGLFHVASDRELKKFPKVLKPFVVKEEERRGACQIHTSLR